MEVRWPHLYLRVGFGAECASATAGGGYAERRTRYSVDSVSGPALFRKLDSLQLPVRDLAAAIAFYERLGHEVIWRRQAAAGLRLPDTDAELVLQTERPGAEVDLLVEDADEAIKRFVGAGGRLIERPFDMRSAAVRWSRTHGATGSSCSTRAGAPSRSSP
jgi:lactoylglutathione lyase